MHRRITCGIGLGIVTDLCLGRACIDADRKGAAHTCRTAARTRTREHTRCCKITGIECQIAFRDIDSGRIGRRGCVLYIGGGCVGQSNSRD